MIIFTKPKNLNGEELRQELNAAGVNISNEKFSVVVDGENNLLLDINPKDKSEAEKIVATHNGTIVPPEPTIEDKLASVGLNLNDLKSVLGL